MAKHTIEIDDETNKKLKYYKLMHGTANVSETIRDLAKCINIPTGGD